MIELDDIKRYAFWVFSAFDNTLCNIEFEIKEKLFRKYYLPVFYSLHDVKIKTWKTHRVDVDKVNSCYKHYAYKQIMSALFSLYFQANIVIIISLGKPQYCTTCIMIHLFCTKFKIKPR